MLPRLGIVLTLAALACGSSDDADDTDGGPADRDGGADAQPGLDGSSATVVGEIRVTETVGQAGGFVVGQVAAGGLPRFHSVAMDDGTCRLLVHEISFCEPVCNSGFCVDGACVDFAERADAGQLTVSGLESPLTLDPGDFGFNGYGYQASITGDLFDPGDRIVASAPGATFPAFSVSAIGVTTVSADVINQEITLPNGADTTFTWTPGDGSARVRLTLNANNVGGHGSPFSAIIECDSPDTGSITIPRAMVEAFPDTFRWEFCAGSDCPLSTFARYSRGAVPVAGGELALIVASEILFYVIHDRP